MFGGGDDPFGGMFRQMHRQMQEMDRIMDSFMDPLDPFGRMGMRRQHPNNNMIQNAPVRGNELAAPFGGFGGPFGGMGGPFGGFGGMGGMGGFGGIGGIFNAMNQLQHQAMNDNNCQVFCHSTSMTFDGNGAPRVVERTVRKRGDTKEERRRYRDSEREEMAIGHTIGDRTHIMEKKRDKDGNVRKQQKLINLDESNVDDFNREFQHRARGANRSSGTSRQAIRGPRESEVDNQSAVSERHTVRDQSYTAPIITLPEEDDGPSGEQYNYSQNGPVIREISEEEAESSIPKRRKGLYGNHARDQ